MQEVASSTLGGMACAMEANGVRHLIQVRGFGPARIVLDTQQRLLDHGVREGVLASVCIVYVAGASGVSDTKQMRDRQHAPNVPEQTRKISTFTRWARSIYGKFRIFVKFAVLLHPFISCKPAL
jgi:hypothetical protein